MAVSILAAVPTLAAGPSETAHWIWADQEEAPNTWVAFRTEVDLAVVPAHVPARIAADSKYWLWLNGELVVFEGALKRGPRPDATWVDEIDLAPHLRPGANCIAILVWFWGKDGFSHSDSGEGGLLFEADLGAGLVASGAAWKATRHPAYLGTSDDPQPSAALPEHNVHFDARLDWAGDWRQFGFDDTGWPIAAVRGKPPVGPWGELVARSIPQWRFGGYMDFVDREEIPDGEGGAVIIGRLPYNAQVTPFFEIEAPAGLTIDVRTDNYQVGQRFSVRTEYDTREGVQSFESLAWFNGDEVHFTIPDGVEVRRLGYRESGFAADFEGSFSSNDPFLDSLWRKAARTTYVNLRDTFMDCPDRERAQWWGDVVNEMPQAFYALDPAVHSLARKAIHDLIAWRKDGVVLHSPVPSGNYDKELPVQMLASIGRLGFWQYYLHTDDDDTINEVLDRVVDYLGLWQEEPGGLVVHRSGDWDWFDWGVHLDKPVIENAWFALALRGAIDMADATERPDLSAELTARLARLRSGFDQRFWTGVSYRSPDHPGPPDDRANALAVVAGLASEDRWRAVGSVLMTHAFASPFMERIVLEALFQMRYADEAIFRMRARFGPMVEDPQTTLWEYWNRESGSDNHGWSGGPLILLSAYVAGIAPVMPGWDRYRVRPQLARLDQVSATVATIRGPASVSHLRSDTEHSMDLQSPSGTTALVAVPAFGLGGGEVFEILVDGSVVWESSGHSNLPGVTFAGRSATYITFEVEPGDWSFLARSTPGLLFSDGFESGDLSFWE